MARLEKISDKAGMNLGHTKLHFGSESSNHLILENNLDTPVWYVCCLLVVLPISVNLINDPLEDL